MMYRLAICMALMSASFAIGKDGIKSPHLIFEDVINSTIEALRPDIPDPLTIDLLKIDAPNDGFLNGSEIVLENFDVKGLQGFHLAQLIFDGNELNFTLILPNIEIQSGYDVDNVLLNTIPLFGHGNLSVVDLNLSIRASLKINLDDGITVTGVWIQLYLEQNMKIDIEGLFENEALSKIVSDLLSNVFPTLIDDNQELITGILSPLIEDLINGIIGGVTTRSLTAAIVS